MLEPARIKGFLDFFGEWDPTLAVVMAGALLVAVPGGVFAGRHRVKQGAPTPEAPKHLTKELVIGSALFGVGWALAGYCPGPGLATLALGTFEGLAFVMAMTTGAFLWEVTLRDGVECLDSRATEGGSGRGKRVPGDAAQRTLSHGTTAREFSGR
jgi:uncharacterized membrane protein YedE/YeeE